MVFKKGNPGCACCCPCYYFEENGGNNRPLTEHNAVYSETSSEGTHSAKFEGASYFERERHWCFTPYGKTTWTVSFHMKVHVNPDTDQTQYMGLVTRGSIDGDGMSGEWGIFYKAVGTGTTVFLALKTGDPNNTENILPVQVDPDTGEKTSTKGFTVSSVSVNPTNSDFVKISWTLGPGKTSTATLISDTTQTLEDTYLGELTYEDTALLVGNNTGQLKLGENSSDGNGGTILIDRLCFEYT